MKNMYDLDAPEKLPYFAAFLPDNYFDSLQSPMIRLDLIKGTTHREYGLKMSIESNDFMGNHLV